MGQTRTRQALLLACALTLLVALTLHMIAGAAMDPWSSDFGLGYTFAKATLMFGWTHAYDASWLARERPVYSPHEWAANVYTPWQMLLLAPFATVPLAAASWLWSAFLLLCAVVTWRLVSPFHGPVSLVVLGVSLAMPPVLEVFHWQQVVAVVALCVALSWWLVQSRQPWLAGAALACGMALKPQLAFVVPVTLLVAREWRVLAGTALTSTALAAGAYLVFGAHSLGQFASNLSYASAHSFAFNVRLTDSVLPVLPGAVARAAQLAFIVLAVVAVWRAREHRTAVAYGGGIGASLLATPYVHWVDWAMILPAAAIAWPAIAPAFKRRWVVVVTAAAALASTGLNLPTALLTLGLLVWLAARRSPDAAGADAVWSVARGQSRRGAPTPEAVLDS